MTPAWLQLNGITFDTILGCRPEERTAPRPVLVDLAVCLDITEAAQTDFLPATINTEYLETLVIDTARANYNLIETLAHAIATRITAEPHVLAVTVRVEKPGALPHTRSTSVTLTLPCPTVSKPN